MGMTISPENPPRIDDEVYECQCLWNSDNNYPNPECWECKGSGEVRFERYAYSLSITYGTGNYALGYALGRTIDPEEYCGSIPVSKLPACIDRMKEHLAQPWIDGNRYDHFCKSVLEILEWANENQQEVSWG